MSEQGSELLPAELLAQGESLVYKVGGVVWKIYPQVPIDQLQRYQQVTNAVASVLNGTSISFDTSNGIFSFEWQVNPITEATAPQDELFIRNSQNLLLDKAINNPDTPILKVRYPYTVSPYIDGPTMEEIIQGTTSEYTSIFNSQDALNRRLFNTALRKLGNDLNRQLGLNCVGLAERNIKPLPDNQLCITDVSSAVRLVK